MEIDGSALDDGLEEVALEELDSNDDREGDQGDLPSLVGKSYKHGDETGEGRSDKGHQPAKEHEHRQRQREGHPEQPDTEGGPISVASMAAISAVPRM